MSSSLKCFSQLHPSKGEKENIEITVRGYELRVFAVIVCMCVRCHCLYVCSLSLSVCVFAVIVCMCVCVCMYIHICICIYTEAIGETKT